MLVMYTSDIHKRNICLKHRGCISHILEFYTVESKFNNPDGISYDESWTIVVEA